MTAATNTSPVMSTTQVERIHGVADWADLVSSMFVPLECRGGSDAFHGVLRSALVGEMRFTRISASAHRVSRTRRTIARNDPGTYKVSLQLTGAALLSQGGRDTMLRPGDLAVYDTSRPYTLSFDAGSCFDTFVLMFPKEVFGVPQAPMARVTATAIRSGEGLGALISPFLARLADSLSGLEPLVSFRLAHNVLDLLDTVFRERLDLDAAEPETLRRSRLIGAEAWIRRHLDQPDLTPNTIAAACHMSVRYLYRLFEQEGTTVARWIKDQRLEGCRRELADPALARFSVGAIAARWGMLDPATFSRAFRAAYGESPREFRARHRPTASTTIKP